jgi:hypothetical protein
LDDGRVAGDRDRFLHGGKPEREVDHCVLSGVEPQVLADLRGKARDLDLHPVGTLRGQRAHHEASVLVGGDRSCQTGSKVLDRDRRAR